MAATRLLYNIFFIQFWQAIQCSQQAVNLLKTSLARTLFAKPPRIFARLSLTFVPSREGPFLRLSHPGQEQVRIRI